MTRHHHIHPNLLKFLEPVREAYRQQIRELWGAPAVRPKMEMLRKLEAIKQMNEDRNNLS